MQYFTRTKDPDSVVEYRWDWSEWLTGGDTIDTADFTVYTADGKQIPDSDDTPVDVESATNTDTTATARLTGGTVGNTYLVTCHIVTTATLQEDQSLKLIVVEH